MCVVLEDLAIAIKNPSGGLTRNGNWFLTWEEEKPLYHVPWLKGGQGRTFAEVYNVGPPAPVPWTARGDTGG